MNVLLDQVPLDPTADLAFRMSTSNLFSAFVLDVERPSTSHNTIPVLTRHFRLFLIPKRLC